MTKKIAILGGGMAGLAAAYELTRTEALRAQHDVTVYQMGWRLGGKAASGRDASDRNLEHGLHVWFGCYENVFRLTREVYEAWSAPPGCVFRHWTDVAKPQTFTPIGVEQDDGRYTYYPLEWPLHEGIPGDGQEIGWSPRDALRAIGEMIARAVLDTAGDQSKLRANGLLADAAPFEDEEPLPAAFESLTLEASPLERRDRIRAHSLWRGAQSGPLSFEHYADAARLWTRSLLSGEGPIDADSAEQIATLYWKAEQHLLHTTRKVRYADADKIAASPLELKFRLMRELLHIAAAMTRGYLLDLLLPDASFESLDGVDLRDWLEHHGADRELLDHSSVLRIVYDTLFQYKEGKVEQPSYAAGTALGVIARLTVTYKSAMMWEIEAGMGESLIAPLYEVLRSRGVKFRFFHKVKKLELSPDEKAIERVRIKVQARARSGDYEPLKTHPMHHFRFWPHEPDWSQLETPGARPDFENHWLDGPELEERVLQRGADFHEVVLAISMGAYKPLNPEPGMCDQLIAASPPFADFVNNIGIVPTQALQLWSDRTPAELGWPWSKAATVSGPQYLNIWADMSQVLKYENWPAGRAPRSLHYLCGTLATNDYRRPASDGGAPAAIRARLRAEQIGWLNTGAAASWPAARKDGGFDFAVLTDPAGNNGEQRFDAQHYRANVSPTECCVLSSAGTTRYRLLPRESGFDNLVLAGEATRHGFNTTAIEGAVMSGMAASLAICGSPARIPGYDFLQRRPWQRETDVADTDIVSGAGGNPLPPYLSFLGHGAAAMAPPARFTGAKAYLFVAPASRAAMQTLVDGFLTRAARGYVKYDVTAPLALVSFMDIERCASATDDIGWVPGRECAIWIPLLERAKNSLPRPVLWSPYIFINYPIGLVCGREIWGWNKNLADIHMPRNENDPVTFSCNTVVFKTFAPETKGESQPLFSISGDLPLQRADSPLQKARDALQAASSVLSSAASPFLSVLGLPLVSAVALKQFRHSEHPELACYQAIVDSPVRITRFKRAGLLAGRFNLNVGAYASHRIAENIFGRTPAHHGASVPLQFAAWAEFDFQALPGKVIASSSE